MFVLEEFYINTNPLKALRVTDLSLDELESIVGRYKANSCRSGQLRGKVVVKPDSVEIWHCFKRKKLWSSE